MKAVVLKSPGKIIVESIPIFPLRENEVMVKVFACGICGSDIRYYKGENPWSLHTRGVKGENPPNIILGHEFSGEVVDVGSSSYSNLEGKRVAVIPYKICGTCYHCRRGMHNLCQNMIHLGHGAGWGKMDYYPGGMAEYCPVWGEMCYLLPENLSFEESAFLDLIGVATHAVIVSGFKPNRDVAIIGSGPLGLSIGQIVKAWGANRIFCIDTYEKPLEIAFRLSIGYTINTKELDFAEKIMEETASEGINIIFDTVCSEETQKKALGILSSQGTLVNMATNAREVSLNLTVLGQERTIKGSSNFLIPEFQIAIDLLSSGKVKVKEMITHNFKIEDVQKAFDILLDKEKYGAFKVIIRPN